MNKTQLYDYVEDRLEDVDFETILEDFELTPQEVFLFLYKNGMIDEDLIVMPCDKTE